jgi:hypothetical protein
MFLFRRANTLTKIIQPVKSNLIYGPKTTASIVFVSGLNKPAHASSSGFKNRMLMHDFDIDEYRNAHIIALKMGQIMLEHRTKIMELYNIYTTLRSGWKIFGEWTDECHEIEALNTNDPQTRFSVFWSSHVKMYIYSDTDGYTLFKTAHDVINFLFHMTNEGFVHRMIFTEKEKTASENLIKYLRHRFKAGKIF